MKNPLKQPKKTTADDMKPFLTACAAAYHLFPFVIAVALGDRAPELLSLVLLMILPMFSFVCGFVFGIRHGFAVKLPLVCTLIFLPSVIMYYNPVTTPPELAEALVQTLINTVVCFLFLLGACAVGAFLKKYIN